MLPPPKKKNHSSSQLAIQKFPDHFSEAKHNEENRVAKFGFDVFVSDAEGHRPRVTAVHEIEDV